MIHALLVIWLLCLILFLGACRTAPSLVRVDGDSMLPALHDGQLVFIDTLTRDFAVGDVVLVQHPSHKAPVIHRIVWIGTTTVRTRGDNNDATDAPITRSAILGRAIGFSAPEVTR